MRDRSTSLNVKQFLDHIEVLSNSNGGSSVFRTCNISTSHVCLSEHRRLLPLVTHGAQAALSLGLCSLSANMTVCKYTGEEQTVDQLNIAVIYWYYTTEQAAETV